MNNEHDFNNLRDAITEHFANKPPADAVPYPGLNREALIGLDLLASGGQLIATQDGTLHVEGDTVTATAPDTYTDPVTAPVVTRAALDQAGLTADQVPHLRVVG